MTDRERTPNYNPADYAEVQEQAKEMNRKDLEDAWVLTKDKAYSKPAWTFLKVILWLFVIWMVAMAIISITIDATQYKVIKKVDKMEEELCPTIGNFQYTIQDERHFRDKIEVYCWMPIE